MLLANIPPNQDVHVLIVDDEPSIVDFIESALLENGYRVHPFTDPMEAVDSLEEIPVDLALVDINMPGISGYDVAKKVAEKSPDTEIIIITGVPDEKNLDPCLEIGLTHYLFKPFNESQLIYSVYATLHYKRLRNAYASSVLSHSTGSSLIGVSMSVRDIRDEIAAIAPMNIPVLILGKSGTGKEIIASDIHGNSQRSAHPFIPINCATLGHLADSELFGHARGSFTGAATETKGLIGAAEKGTLFFDEVGELPQETQGKLLRFLDSGEYYRVGESKQRFADVRVIAATNRNIEEMCEIGSFREDLYFRFSGSVIRTATLDERKADIYPLVWHFLNIFGTEKNVTYEISSEAVGRLVESEWPGNVRQLRQTLYKISEMSASRKISYADVCRVLGGGQQAETQTYRDAKEHALEEFDREYLTKTLIMAQGSLKDALRLSGMHKKNFYAKIKRLGLAMKDFK